MGMNQAERKARAPEYPEWLELLRLMEPEDEKEREATRTEKKKKEGEKAQEREEGRKEAIRNFHKKGKGRKFFAKTPNGARNGFRLARTFSSCISTRPQKAYFARIRREASK